MEQWEKSLREFQIPVNITIMNRGRKIKSLLEILSNYPHNYIKTFKNISSNSDLPRNELRGAVQRYLLGNFIDSILFTCFSVEFGLIVQLDRMLTDNEKRKIKKPFTFGRIIKKSIDYSLLNSSTKKAALELLNLRNAHVHGSNFIAALMLSYKKYSKLFDESGLVDIQVITEGLDKLMEKLPQNVATSILKTYEPLDFIEAYDTIQSLSTFEWAADKRIIDETTKEIDEVMTSTSHNVPEKELVSILSPSYFIEMRALRALLCAEQILLGIEIIQ